LSGFSQGTASDRLLEGAAYLRAGDLDRAAQIIEAVLGEEPDLPNALLAMAGVASGREQHRLAMDYCRKAIDLDPGFIDAYQQLGVSALRAGEPLEAIRALERAATLSPSDKEVFNRLGVAYAQSGRAEEAGNAWRRALEIDPMFEKARHNLRRLDP
jgi:tetratricopeptide (TPR) repeat protein